MLRFATLASLAIGANAIATPLAKRAALETCLTDAKVPIDKPGTDDYELDSAPFNVRTPYTPAAIAVPTTEKHIQDAIACGVKNGVKVTPKCGGHSYANYGFGGEDGHLMLELDRMSKVTIDDDGIATVEGGSRLGHVAYTLFNDAGRAFSHGTCPGVGSGGHVLHGGYGMSSHTKGLALDWMVGATVVLANSTVVNVSETENPDLYWAVRGAGSSMGVVSSFKFKTFEPPEKLTHFNAVLGWNARNSAASLKRIQEWAAEEMPHEMNARVFLTPQMPNFEGLFYGTKDDLMKILDPLLDEVHGFLQEAEETDWVGQATHFGHGLSLDQTHPYNKQENIYSTSLYTDALTDDQIDRLVDYWYNVGKKTRRQWYHHIDLHGGKTSAISAMDDSTSSYAYRDKLLMHNFYDRVDVDEVYPADGFNLFDGFIEALTKGLKPSEYGMYFNYPDPNMDQEKAQEMYWGKNLPRLQEIKAQVDPDEVFYLPQSVRPAKSADKEKAPKKEKEEPPMRGGKPPKPGKPTDPTPEKPEKPMKPKKPSEEVCQDE